MPVSAHAASFLKRVVVIGDDTVYVERTCPDLPEELSSSQQNGEAPITVDSTLHLYTIGSQRVITGSGNPARQVGDLYDGGDGEPACAGYVSTYETLTGLERVPRSIKRMRLRGTWKTQGGPRRTINVILPVVHSKRAARCAVDVTAPQYSSPAAAQALTGDPNRSSVVYDQATFAGGICGMRLSTGAWDDPADGRRLRPGLTGTWTVGGREVPVTDNFLVNVPVGKRTQVLLTVRDAAGNAVTVTVTVRRHSGCEISEGCIG
jgi:hypothetical protein